MIFIIPPSNGWDREISHSKTRAIRALAVIALLSLVVALPLILALGCVPVKRAQVCVEVSGVALDAGKDAGTRD